MVMLDFVVWHASSSVRLNRAIDVSFIHKNTESLYLQACAAVVPFPNDYKPSYFYEELLSWKS